MLWRLLFVLLFATPLLSYGQVFSSKGRFSISFDKGCAPFTVNITELDSFGDVTREYYYNAADLSDNSTTSTTFTYNEGGIYQIVQVVGVDGIPDKTDTLQVEVKTSPKPLIEIQKCSQNQLFLTSMDNFYDSVKVFFTTTDSIILGTNQTTSFTYFTSGLQVLEIRGQFNNADDVCSSFFEEVETSVDIAVPEIVNAQVKETCRDIYSLFVTLDHIDTLSRYRLAITQNSTQEIFTGFVNQRFLSFSNIPFDFQDFCIEISALDPCQGRSIEGAGFCAYPTELSVSPFETLYSTITDSGVYVNLDSLFLGRYNIYRRIRGENYEFRSEQKQSFTDPSGSLARPYQYRVDYIDSCEQILFSTETFPPLIETSEEGTNTYRVQFTPPLNSFTEIPENQYQAGLSGNQSTGTITDNTFFIQLNVENGSPRQIINATSTYANGLVLSSNQHIVKYDLMIYVPSAFTPNGDGLNDRLEIFGLPTEVGVLRIFNRWGQLVHVSEKSSPDWDGTIGGKTAPEGTYLYEITFETVSGEVRSQNGTFALINK